MQTEDHYAHRSGWLRAAVLGANDGILSTASLIIGVAAASTTREPIILPGLQVSSPEPYLWQPVNMCL